MEYACQYLQELLAHGILDMEVMVVKTMAMGAVDIMKMKIKIEEMVMEETIATITWEVVEGLIQVRTNPILGLNKATVIAIAGSLFQRVAQIQLDQTSNIVINLLLLRAHIVHLKAHHMGAHLGLVDHPDSVVQLDLVVHHHFGLTNMVLFRALKITGKDLEVKN